MMRVRNWTKFQHYRDRRPPWIKLHREVLDDPQIGALSDRAYRVLTLCWLIASDDPKMAGNLPPVEDIAFKARMSVQSIDKALQELTHFIKQDASSTLATCSSETETEERQSRDRVDQFASFWSTYPKKVGRKAALKAWRQAKDRPPIETVLAAIERAKGSEQWRKDGGQYIPNPATWINQGRWDDGVVEVDAPRMRCSRCKAPADDLTQGMCDKCYAADKRERGIE